MSILSIRHLTRYHYRRPVGLGEHRMMLRPRESYDQRLLSFDVTIGPAPSRLRYVHDVFGNCVGVAEFAGRASELSFDARARLEHTPLPAFAGPHWHGGGGGGWGHHGFGGPGLAFGLAGGALALGLAATVCTKWVPTYDDQGNVVGRHPVNVC